MRYAIRPSGLTALERARQIRARDSEMDLIFRPCTPSDVYHEFRLRRCACITCHYCDLLSAIIREMEDHYVICGFY